MNRRQVPDQHGWLRRYLNARLNLIVPLGIDDDEWKHICDEIPGADWKRLKNAYRQREHGFSATWRVGINDSCQQSKHLGPYWRRLIAADLVTEEDALILAESRGYSDPSARELISGLLYMEAERCKNKDEAELNGSVLEAVSAMSEYHKTTDPDEIAELAKIPVTSVTKALAKLNALVS
jgi:hypothetical protein